MDTSQPSTESSVPAHNIVEEEAVGECGPEEVDSSVTMVGPSQELKKPCHHQSKHSTANTPSSEMVFHKAGTRTGGGTGGIDVNDNHYSGHVEGVMCGRKTASFGSGTGSLLLCHSQEDISKFNTSNRKGPNCATFYIKHLDTDSDRDIGRGDMGAAEEGRLAEAKSVEDSSDDEWTYKQGSVSPARVNGISDGSASGSASESASVRRWSASKKNSVVMRLDFGSGLENAANNNDESSDMILNGKSESTNKTDEPRKPKGSPGRNSLEAIHRLVSQAEEMVREEASPDKMPASAKASREFEPLVFSDVGKISGNSQAKYTRIRQWLDSKSVLQVSCINVVCNMQLWLLWYYN
jgi:hypothetical protein